MFVCIHDRTCSDDIAWSLAKSRSIEGRNEWEGNSEVVVNVDEEGKGDKEEEKENDEGGWKIAKFLD